VPRVIKASIIINFQKSGDLTASQWTKLRTLTKQGIAENWSRTGARAVRLSNNLVRKRGGAFAVVQQTGAAATLPARLCLTHPRQFSASPPFRCVNAQVYDVIVSVVERSSGHNVELNWNTCVMGRVHGARRRR
jgi:hypothetical protein